MMVCRVVAYRSLSIALGLAPTPSTRKRRDFQNHAFFVNIIQYNGFPVNTHMSIMRRTFQTHTIVNETHDRASLRDFAHPNPTPTHAEPPQEGS